jgi:hypothetical protein
MILNGKLASTYDFVTIRHERGVPGIARSTSIVNGAPDPHALVLTSVGFAPNWFHAGYSMVKSPALRKPTAVLGSSNVG